MDFWKNCKEKNNKRNAGKIQEIRSGYGVPKLRGQRLWIPGTVLGIVFLCLGAFHGQFEIIWKKAVMICLECIGIG